jgi:NAD-dependent oxidoreductase involved in siderophore biosynthesis
MPCAAPAFAVLRKQRQRSVQHPVVWWSPKLAQRNDFREPFAAVVRAADQLHELLRAEKQSHERTWTRREHAYGELARKTTAIDESLRTIFEGEARARNGKLVALR